MPRKWSISFARPASRLGAALAAVLALTPLTARAPEPAAGFDQRILAVHNSERAKFGVPALRWSARLAADADEWAEVLARTGRFMHSAYLPADPQGENLWRGTTNHWTVEEMVDMWLSERRHYTHGIFPANSRTGRFEDVGHYTQIIWRDTTEVGCALRKGARMEVLVCRYAAPGNVMGRSPV